MGDIVIVANKNIPENSLSTEDIKNIFLGKKKKWNDNSPIIVVLNNSKPVHHDLLNQYIRRTPSQFKNTWRRLVFSGGGRYPRTFSEDTEVIDFVSSFDGAVSYIDIRHVNDSVKIIQPE